MTFVDVRSRLIGLLKPPEGPVRVAMIVITALAVVVAITTDIPPKVPNYALGDAWVLRAERGAAVLLALLLVAMVLGRGLQGRLPTKITREGPEWEGEVAEAVSKGLTDVQASVDVLREQQGQGAQVAAKLADALGAVDERVGKLEKGGAVEGRRGETDGVQ